MIPKQNKNQVEILCTDWWEQGYHTKWLNQIALLYEKKGFLNETIYLPSGPDLQLSICYVGDTHTLYGAIYKMAFYFFQRIIPVILHFSVAFL